MKTKITRIHLTLWCLYWLGGCGIDSSTQVEGSRTRLLATSSSAASYATVVQQLYVSYFGRPADAAGLTFYEGILANAGAPTTLSEFNAAYGSNASVKTIIDGFGNSAESDALYGSDTNVLVNAVYRNLFNRDAEPAGLAFWSGLIDDGTYSRGQAALIIMSGAQTTDLTVVNKKVTIATSFTSALTTPAQVAAYSGLAPNVLVRSMLASVAYTTDSTEFQASISATISALVTPGSSYLIAAGTTRSWLTASDLQSAKSTPNSPLHNSHFMPVGTGALPVTPFSGSIQLTSFDLKTDDPYPGDNYVDMVFPNAELSFVSDGNDLIPVNREILVGSNSSSSRLILGPGMAWSEPTDDGWSRASFPFEVVVATWNITRNGIATFIYNESNISSVRVQMVQESIGGSSAHSNIWATLTANYIPRQFAEKQDLIAQFGDEKSSYLPVSPWADITSRLKVDTSTFNYGIRADRISMTGVVKDGVIYRQPCHTRFGDYPYCDQMRAGAFSATKSMGAAVALLRLAQKYGDNVAGLRIKDYVNVTATHNGWDNVTFLDALNMATGIGDNAANVPTGTGAFTLVDENSDLTNAVFSTQGENNMLAIAFTQGKYNWGPGVEMRYNSIHTFILSAAMDAYLKQKEGPDAHLWDMVVNEVYKPIGIAHAPMMHTVESDGSRGIPFMDIGLYPTADDTAKVATLFQQGGSHNGQQLLSAALTAKALYRTADQGLLGAMGWGNQYGLNRYLMSFWSVPWSDGAGCTVRVPYMSGSGANVVALLPNGVTVFRFTHENSEYNGTSLIQAGANLGGMCP